MTPKFYYYEHCPYCIRVLAVLKMANVSFDSVVLLNDDESTPIGLIGKKMLPILQVSPTGYLAESLEIIDYLTRQYQFSLLRNNRLEKRVEEFLGKNRQANYSLCMPRWVEESFKEFATQEAKDYFINKKTLTIGDFNLALSNTPMFIHSLQSELKKNIQLFDELSENIHGIAAVVMFSGLYGLKCVKQLEWPDSAKIFMQKMSDVTKLSF